MNPIKHKLQMNKVIFQLEYLVVIEDIFDIYLQKIKSINSYVRKKR